MDLPRLARCERCSRYRQVPPSEARQRTGRHRSATDRSRRGVPLAVPSLRVLVKSSRLHTKRQLFGLVVAIRQRQLPTNHVADDWENVVMFGAKSHHASLHIEGTDVAILPLIVRRKVRPERIEPRG